mmetsp:Transcript_30210/g.79934  ORF Transcript_30210/g.79934 Transcript_30210/m.79934 type:complete len:296 (+) Transcript_30210:140-1027(+)
MLLATTINLNVIYLALSDQGESSIAHFLFSCSTSPEGILGFSTKFSIANVSFRLLLQQRAKEKITFPEVWTNTCCSHPLTGYTPTEQDEPHHVADGSVPGVKRAAIRKLEHELGIPASQFEIDDFRFVARLHYWAADAVTHGPESPFGEHEIDYVLFVQKTVTLEPNASEVGGFEYVTPEQLLTLMMPESGRLWSPWFRILATRLLLPLWSRLPAILDGSERPDVTKIQRFDCAEEFLGGAGGAGRWLNEPGSTAFGDAWLGEVQIGGGKAPSTGPMKGLLARGPDGQWRFEANE